MIRYKINVVKALRDAGYTTYYIRKHKILSQSVMQKLRNNKPITWDKLNLICKLIGCQPGDIMEYVPDADDEK